MDLSALPQVDALLRRDDLRETVERHGRRPALAAARAVLEEARAAARERGEPPDAERLARAVADRLAAGDAARTRRVVNATGVLLHTNLGRSPLSAAAVAAVTQAAGYATVEYDLAAGARGSRTAGLGDAVAALCDADAALVVNNGAAALLLTLAVAAAGREVIVSRGELIEIGGSYRLPDLVRAAGARLREVGTTNRTRVEDFAAAVGPETGAILQVHPSNYRIVGFTEAPTTRDLAALARRSDVPFIHDLGSGLVDPVPELAPVLSDEPTVTGALRDAADLVVFSGDKLLGGPQAGVIVGDAGLVARCRRHPLARAVRIDKLQRAALEATLAALARAGGPLPPSLPLGAMLRTPLATLRERAESVAARSVDAGGPKVAVVATRAVVGGGAGPGDELDSWGLRVDGDAEDVAAALRRADPPVVGRIDDGAVVLDLRAVPPGDDDAVVAALRALGP